jgi:hypothetical protein
VLTDNNLNVSPITQSVALNGTGLQGSQTISFTAPVSPATYGVSPITLVATASSGLAPTFSIVSGPGSVSGSTLTVTGAGTIVIAANQAGNTSYAAAAQVTQTLTINAIAETVTATNETVNYGGSMPTLAYTISPAMTPGTTPTCSSTANASSTPGDYSGAITCSGAAATGYSFTYVSGQMTVNATGVSSIKVTGYPTTASNGVASNVTVTVYDGTGNPVQGYSGTITLASSDSTMTYSLVSSLNGVLVFSVTMNYAGTQSLTATDSTADISGSQTGISVGDLIWVVNSNGTLTKLNSAGGSSSTTSGSPSNAVAVDRGGNAWSLGSGSLLEYSNTGAAMGTYTGGGINLPVALVVDGNGAVWTVNGNNSLSQFSHSGAAISPSTGYSDSSIKTPTGIAIDNAGSVWVANSGNNSVTRIIGGAAPVITPTVNATSSNSVGVKP